MSKQVAAVCVDASVGVKWFLTEQEDETEPAHKLLQAFARGSINLVVPELFFYEIGNVFSVAVGRGRISAEQALLSLDELERLQLDTVCLSGEMDAVLAVSQRLGISFYDAAYLVTAEIMQAPMITADVKLRRSVFGQVPWVLRLEEMSWDGPS